jgi:NADH:ubiquinone oxidoreductase subunit K
MYEHMSSWSLILNLADGPTFVQGPSDNFGEVIPLIIVIVCVVIAIVSLSIAVICYRKNRRNRDADESHGVESVALTVTSLVASHLTP